MCREEAVFTVICEYELYKFRGSMVCLKTSPMSECKNNKKQKVGGGGGGGIKLKEACPDSLFVPEELI